MILLNNEVYSLAQAEHIGKMKELDGNVRTMAEFVAEPAREAYVTAVCRSDATYIFNAAKQIGIPKQDTQGLWTIQ